MEKYLYSELLLLASEPGPHICLLLVWGSPEEQVHQQGIAGRPCQVLTQLCYEHSQVIVDANLLLLGVCLLSESGDYDYPQEPAFWECKVLCCVQC